MVDSAATAAPTDDRDASLLEQRNVGLLPWVLRA